MAFQVRSGALNAGEARRDNRSDEIGQEQFCGLPGEGSNAQQDPRGDKLPHVLHRHAGRPPEGLLSRGASHSDEIFFLILYEQTTCGPAVVGAH